MLTLSAPILPLKKPMRSALYPKAMKGYDPAKTYGKCTIRKDKLAVFVSDIERESKASGNNDYEDCMKRCLFDRWQKYQRGWKE